MSDLRQHQQRPRDSRRSTSSFLATPRPSSRAEQASGVRYVYVNDRPANNRQRFATNRLRTAKYTWWDLLPKALFEQFKRLSNFYFLFVAVISFVPDISPYSPWASVSPLFVVVGFGFARDVYEDVQRSLEDRRQNSEGHVLLTPQPPEQLPQRPSALRRSRRDLDSERQHGEDNDNVDNKENMEFDVEAETVMRRRQSETNFQKGVVDMNIHTAIQAKDITVGDIVLVKKDQTFPCDLVLLHAASGSDVAYVSTANLDGESSLKRVVVVKPSLSSSTPATAIATATVSPSSPSSTASTVHSASSLPSPSHAPAAVADLSSAQALSQFRCMIRAQKAVPALHEFSASMIINDAPVSLTTGQTHPSSAMTALSADNLLLRGSILKNTDFIYGTAVYTGRDTKVALNMRKPVSKLGTLERMLNLVVFFIFLALVLLIVLCAVVSGIAQTRADGTQWYMQELRFMTGTRTAIRGLGTFLILFSTFIPSSLFVTLEFVRVVQALFIVADVRMRDNNDNDNDKNGMGKERQTVARSMNLNETLGEVDHILTDKTGTLTENDMRFVACAANNNIFNVLEDRQAIARAVEQGNEPVKHLLLAMAICHSCVIEPIHDASSSSSSSSAPPTAQKKADVSAAADITTTTTITDNINKERHSVGDDHDDDDDDDDDHERDDDNGPDSEKRRARWHRRRRGKHKGGGVGDDDDVYSHSNPKAKAKAKSDLSGRSAAAPRAYQGQSPDEVALVSSAREYGVGLVERTAEEMIVEEFGTARRYRVLHELEFSSDRKRMSVIVRQPGTGGGVRLYCKGADSVMLGLLRGGRIGGTGNAYIDKAKVQEHIDRFAKLGLRTLVYGYRDLTEQEYTAWARKYHAAVNTLDDGREEAIAAACNDVERHLSYLATTAVEDRLQDMVPQTIKFMREASIKLWVLTGDKRETAENVGYSANLLSPHMQVVHLRADSSATVEVQLSDALSAYGPGGDVGTLLSGTRRRASSLDELRHKLSDTIRRSSSSLRFGKGKVKGSGNGTGTRKNSRAPVATEVGLIVDGVSLQFALEDHPALLLRVADVCETVICCRVTPLQKALVVRLVRNHRRATTLAVGDGGNDVSMLQEAHIGVGIYGKEGTQAARSADYAITGFKHLFRLCMIHGRFNALRTAGLINLSFYKNVLFTGTQALFQVFAFATGTSFHDQWVTAAFNVIITAAPPFLFGIFERDVSESTVARFPKLYVAARDHGLSLASVAEYSLLYGVWHALVVFFAVFFLFGYLRVAFPDGKDSGLFLTGLVASAIVTVVTLFKMALHSYTLNWVVLLLFAISFIIFITLIPVSVSMLGNLPMEGQLQMMFSSPAFYLTTAVTIAAAFLLDFIVILVRKCFRPSTTDIVQQWEQLPENRHIKNE